MEPNGQQPLLNVVVNTALKDKERKRGMNEIEMAGLFHKTYERLAPAFGYKTRKRSKVAFAELDKRHKALMIATCGTVLAALKAVQPTTGASTPLSNGCLCNQCSVRKRAACPVDNIC